MHKPSLNDNIKNIYKWYKKLVGRFLNIASIQTISIVFATLFSQIFLLISTMLPLKVIMLLGSNSIPSFFPDSWQNINRDMLIIYLAIASVGFYIFHLLFEKIINISSINGSNKILKNNKKIVLFENQDIFAQKSYTKLAKSLSNIVFVILALIGIGIVYLQLPFVILFYVLITYLLFTLISKKNSSTKVLNEGFNDFLDLLRGIGFFVIFSFILGSFLAKFYTPKIIIVILSILLIRQIFSKLSSAIKDIRNLYKDRIKINSLFFFRDTKVELLHNKKDPFWSLLRDKNREIWIKTLLDAFFESNITYISSQWCRINIKNIAFLKVIVKDANNKRQTYLLKLYNKNISSQAIHEATILQENIPNLYHLPFVASTTVETFHCNIFDCFNIEPVQNFNHEHILIQIKMMSIKSPKKLVERYSRSHPYLYNRLHKEMIEKLYTLANEDEYDTVQDFEKSFENIIQKIKQLPLQIVNPLITKSTLAISEDDFVLLHWGGWKIDVQGTDFPIAIQTIDILKENFNTNCAKVNDIILVSLISKFEKLYNGENFSGVFELLPRIIECIKDEKNIAVNDK